MPGFLDKSINSELSTDIAQGIIKAVFSCCYMMKKDCNDNHFFIANKEERIRDYLFKNYLNNNEIRKLLGINLFLFIPEVPENYTDKGAIGRCDLKVIMNNNFQYTERYFIIECKRLDGHRILNKEYIKNGMQRFLEDNPKYSSYYKINFMLGFLVKKINNSKNVNAINDILTDDYHMNNKALLHFKKNISSYHSQHPNVELFHMFANCASFIK